MREAMVALGRQTGVSISVADAGLWRQRVPAVRGHLSVADALRRMLDGSGATFAAIAPGVWRVMRQPPPPPRLRPAPHPAPPPTEDAPATEIVVTASKRDMRLGDYPGVVNLIDGNALVFGGEGGTEAISRRLASVSSTHLGAGRNKLFIRGIADSSFTGPTQATVGQYLGDMRLNYNAPDPDLRLYDVASVEVLEGPQGTLYGAGSLGGIIRVRRNDPDPDRFAATLSAGIATTAHGAESGDAGAMLNLPLLHERIGLRAVGYAVSDGGYIDDRARGLDDINRTRTLGGRATLRALAGESWTIDIGGTFQRINGEDSQYADLDGPSLSRESLVAQDFHSRYALGDLVVTGTWDDLIFRSSTGIVRQRLSESYDATQPDGPPSLFRQRNRTSLVSTENRLSRAMQDGLGWVVGTSFIHNSARLTRSLGSIGRPRPATGVRNEIDELTLYGEATVALRPGLALTGGGRITHARLSGAGLDVAPEIALTRAGVQADRRETILLPSFAISAHALPGLIFFGRYQKGFRPGGLAISDDFVRRFRNDSIATLESGVRYGAPGRSRFDFAASMAYTRWNNVQADFVDGSGLPTTANIGNGRIYSLDARAGWRPLPNLGLELAAVLNEGKLTDPTPAFRLATLATLSHLPNVAQLAARAGLDYRAMLSDALDMRLSASARYVGKSRLGVGPVLGAAQGDYLDSALTLRIGRPDLGLTLGATNLFDTVGNRFALGSPFDLSRKEAITPLRPRTIRLGIDRRF
ncbi:TonB-dependent receptor [Sphingomonas oleivorans]|uniref:TonB-dependent receptor n=2 Tax=Sphingomonas oleivorans TaxID=1735121 RepID=A0A2T5FUS7_9SPHN|nr:TonB-dependent receptor [Sphingomonas oleivorans]